MWFAPICWSATNASERLSPSPRLEEWRRRIGGWSEPIIADAFAMNNGFDEVEAGIASAGIRIVRLHAELKPVFNNLSLLLHVVVIKILVKVVGL